MEATGREVPISLFCVHSHKTVKCEESCQPFAPSRAPTHRLIARVEAPFCLSSRKTERVNVPFLLLTRRLLCFSYPCQCWDFDSFPFLILLMQWFILVYHFSCSSVLSLLVIRAFFVLRRLQLRSLYSVCGRCMKCEYGELMERY